VQALSYAEEFRLNRSLLNSVAASSYMLSALCMTVIAFTAWSRDLVPIFSSLKHVKASTFPLLDQCVVLVVLLTTAAVFIPRLLVRKVVKMTLSAEDFLKHSGQQAESTLPPSEPPEQARQTAAGAVAVNPPLCPQVPAKFAVAMPRRRNRALLYMNHRSVHSCRIAKL
jgi:hypothetical protein